MLRVGETPAVRRSGMSFEIRELFSDVIYKKRM